MINIKLFIDGNLWCAMAGKDLMVGIAGFGDTQADALAELAHELQSRALTIRDEEELS